MVFRMSLMAWSSSSMACQILLAAVIADQSQRDLEIQPCGEDPADHDVVHALGNPVVLRRQFVVGRGAACWQWARWIE